jgi:pyruvyltransferase
VGLLWLFLLSPILAWTESDQDLRNGLPLYYWQHKKFDNFGDYLSLKLLERIVQQPVETFDRKKPDQKKLLAIGSIISFGKDGDVVWGSGINGKRPNKKDYYFTTLDVRAVRGPLTKEFLKRNFDIDSPDVYGDPALLLPYFFPEFQKKENPSYDYIIIPHYSEEYFFPKSEYPNAIYATDPWDQIIRMILDSKLVISTSLHGVIVAEAFGVPARLLKLTNNEPLFKYQDYYLGTNRPHFTYAKSLEEAIRMGGEPPYQCDLKKLYQSFPFEFWPDVKFRHPDELFGR